MILSAHVPRPRLIGFRRGFFCDLLWNFGMLTASGGPPGAKNFGKFLDFKLFGIRFAVHGRMRVFKGNPRPLSELGVVEFWEGNVFQRFPENS